MSKRKIAAAAKRKGLTIVSAHYGWEATPGRKHTKAERAYAVKIAAAVIDAAKVAASPAPEAEADHG